MGQKEFLERMHFTENPFQFTNADQEEHLQSYFIPPPYFDSVWGDPKLPQSHIILAPRGGGKSAQRRMIEFGASPADVFAITYDRFEQIPDGDLKGVKIEYHLANIVRLGLLGFLLEFNSRGIQPLSFQGAERRQIEGLCEQYLGKINKLEAIDAARALTTLSSKAKQLLHDWSGPLTAMVSALFAAHGHPGVALPQGQAGRGARESSQGPIKLHLEIVRDLILSLGFQAVYILVDKVDETPETGNNAEASFLLMKPLLRDLDLLQTRGIGFKFFLWDKLEPYHARYARPDRVQQFKLSWTQDQINTMLSRRLSAYSNGAVTDLTQLTDASLADPLQFIVVLFSNGSPRDMIRICQEILSEQLRLNSDASGFEFQAIIQGLSRFCAQRASELVPASIFQELRKVGRIDFTTNYIANDIFKIEVNSARNKIEGWKRTGAVEKVGELPTGGRPVYQYALTDIRVAKAILPQMGLGEFLQMKLAWCKNCGCQLLRDCDVQAEQTCHNCGSVVIKKVPSAETAG